MKVLFLIYHGFSETNGISKKIYYQVDALKNCALDVRTCYLLESDRNKYRMIDNNILRDYGQGVSSKILKRVEFNSIADYVIREEIRFVYIRSDHNANPFTINMVKKMHKANIRVVMEIPTSPYDNEYSSFYGKIILFIDKCFRKTFAKYLYRIITFSDYKYIFGTPTIQISNGIDFRKIKLKQNINDTSHELHLIGVAEIHYWHGFDRLVQGLVDYYKGNPVYKVFFHIVGNFFGERESNDIVPLISRHHLEPYIILHGAKHGGDLDLLFEQSDMAIGSLARHRSGITNIKTLKNREYAARGLSFIYSEQDSDFENKAYILKVPADESPININKIIDFHKRLKLNPSEIRNSILSLSWEAQMDKVLKAIEK